MPNQNEKIQEGEGMLVWEERDGDAGTKPSFMPEGGGTKNGSTSSWPPAPEQLADRPDLKGAPPQTQP
jgi:hypothetical protein